ncbi:hypothetical protein HELRODRAFT_90301, partial [Helobdella robusta]|uniref:Uncharacterized protein n=1 Tax=Helobdella robusta TaxID=6412 RepID=T1G7N9_HELRO
FFSVTAKIRILKDYHLRIINSVYPIPSGFDIANNLRYFSQTLIGVLKDVPLSTKHLFIRRKTNRECLQVFPDLDYMHLYETVECIINDVSVILTGQHALGESLLCVLGCLAPFLSSSILDTLPNLVASTLTTFPSSLHRDILMLLCNNLLPVTISNLMGQNCTYATDSVPSVLMIVFQFSHSKEYHSMIVECLMALKKDVYKDLLYVIAYGASQSREVASHLLFYYWPQLNPMCFDFSGIHGTYHGSFLKYFSFFHCLGLLKFCEIGL